MKYIFLNLKRFDIPSANNGVNSLFPVAEWGVGISGAIERGFAERGHLAEDYTFAAFFPEAHLLSAAQAEKAADGGAKTASLEVGCQSVHYADTAADGNFGAFTSLRTANAAKGLGCTWTIIGHSEERRYKAELMGASGASHPEVFNASHIFLSKQISCALNAGLKVLYCIGESEEEVPNRIPILKDQIGQGLAGFDLKKLAANGNLVLAYEPIWAIGPGKTPPTQEQIAEIAAEIKKISPLPLVYGGGLKKENAQSIGAIQELDGGLVALTRFTGTIGFYPDEYLEIIDLYNEGVPL